MAKHKFIITSDAMIDLPDSFVESHDMQKANMIYTIDGVDYDATACNDEFSAKFYNILRNGALPKTSMVNPEQYRQLFLNNIKNGRDILHIGLSATLSPSVNGAKLVAEELMEEYPERKIVVIDSLGASLGEGALAYFAVNMQEEGETLEDTAEHIKYLVPKMCHYFTVNDLFHLQRSGRLSKTSAIVGSALGMKPILHINENGEIKPLSKVRGRKQSLDQLLRKFEEKGKNEENDIIFISHADCKEDSLYLQSEFKNKCGIKKFLMSNIGPVIGNHAGPGTVAVFFIGDTKAEK